MDTGDKALNFFRKGSGFNCAQAVLAAYASQFNFDAEAALKVAAAFGGGIARTGGNCGAFLPNCNICRQPAGPKHLPMTHCCHNAGNVDRILPNLL